MTRKKLILLSAFLLFVASSDSSSQFAGYISGTYGFHQNPLHNYEKLPDQLRQAYVELNYDCDEEASFFKLSYVGGLMAFNRLTERNYYEHNLWARYNIAFRSGQGSFVSPPDGDEVAAESENEDVVSSREDSSGSFLDFGLKFGGRHDKKAYKEYDNFGSAAQASFRVGFGEAFFVRVTNTLDYRRYVYLAELSNVSDAITVQAGAMIHPSVSVGVRAGGGLKHFTSSLYDTLRFEEKRTYKIGKGKGGARIKVPSSKQLLLNAESDNIFQLGIGAFLITKWAAGTCAVEFLYRRNPGSPSRYLAQYVNTTILSDDIYNDHFAFEGPETQIRVTQGLPLGVQSIWTLEHQRKRFGASAVNLVGEQLSGNRIDLRSSAEVYLSRYFELVDGFGMDLALGAEVIRNQSNDVYNDFSHFQISGSIGFGF